MLATYGLEEELNDIDTDGVDMDIDEVILGLEDDIELLSRINESVNSSFNALDSLTEILERGENLLSEGTELDNSVVAGLAIAHESALITLGLEQESLFVGMESADDLNAGMEGIVDTIKNTWSELKRVSKLVAQAFRDIGANFKMFFTSFSKTNAKVKAIAKELDSSGYELKDNVSTNKLNDPVRSLFAALEDLKIKKVDDDAIAKVSDYIINELENAYSSVFSVLDTAGSYEELAKKLSKASLKDFIELLTLPSEKIVKHQHMSSYAGRRLYLRVRRKDAKSVLGTALLKLLDIDPYEKVFHKVVADIVIDRDFKKKADAMPKTPATPKGVLSGKLDKAVKVSEKHMKLFSSLMMSNSSKAEAVEKVLFNKAAEQIVFDTPLSAAAYFKVANIFTITLYSIITSARTATYRTIIDSFRLITALVKYQKTSMGFYKAK